MEKATETYKVFFTSGGFVNQMFSLKLLIRKFENSESFSKSFDYQIILFQDILIIFSFEEN